MLMNKERTMNKATTIISICMITMFCAFAQVKDVVGWQDTSWGMSIEEVQKAVPQAKRLKDKPDKGNVFALSIEKYKIGDQVYDINFRFNAVEPRKLNMVSVARAGNMDPVKYLKAFDDLEKLLTEAYGAPSQRKDTPPANPIIKRYRYWYLKTTKIELGLQAVSNVVILTVAYEPNTEAAETTKQ
jgi:hypothetical protein